MNKPLLDDLKPREIEIIQLMAQGATNQQVADELYITTNTVRWYNKQIYSKFGVNSRIKVVNLAREWGILTEDNVISKEFSSAKETTPLSLNIPRITNPYIGRQQDFVEVQALLATKTLLTITGPAGVGKTRFVTELVSQLTENYADGICFVPLASLQETAQFPKTVAIHLGLKEDSQQTYADIVADYLASRHMLLILDNFEHIMEAADYVQAWLRHCPKLTVLLTSREILYWQIEQVYQLQPLPAGSAEASAQPSEAAQLFIERSGRRQPNQQLSDEDFTTIEEICNYLEGLPLAIELAAARSNLFPLNSMLDQLTHRLEFLKDGPRDLPSRQRSLRNALAWSFDLLDEEEQILFMRLGVFQGGFTLASVESICLDGLEIGLVDGIASLLNKSLLDVYEDSNDEPRFSMLETIREYSAEQLTATPTLQAVYQHHADYFLQEAEEAFRARNSNRQSYLVNRANLEIDNIRATLRHFYQTQQVEKGVRTVSGLHWIFRRQGYFQETIDWYHKFLALDLPISAKVKAEAYIYFADLYKNVGNLAKGQELHRQALHYAEQSAEPTLYGLASGYLALYENVILEDGRDAFDLANQALTAFTEVNDIVRICWIQNLLGELYVWQEDFAQARHHYELSLEIAQELQNSNRIATTYANLGRIAVLENDLKAALDLLDSTLSQNEDAKNIHITNGVLLYTALLLVKADEARTACQLLGVAENYREHFGFVIYSGDIDLHDNTLAQLKSQLTPAEMDEAWSQGKSIDPTEADQYCRDLIHEMQNR